MTMLVSSIVNQMTPNMVLFLPKLNISVIESIIIIYRVERLALKAPKNEATAKNTIMRHR